MYNTGGNDQGLNVKARNGAPVELYRNSPAAIKELHSIFTRMWKGESFTTVGEFCSIYKNKGSQDDPKFYRPICLLEADLKCYTSIISDKMRSHSETVLGDLQNGFRMSRGTRDNLMSLSILVDEVLNQNSEAWITFIDFEAAFDTVKHAFIMSTLAQQGFPPGIIGVVEKVYENAKGRARAGKERSKYFPIRTGVVQGDTLSPMLFVLCLQRVLNQANTDEYVTPTSKIKIGTIGYADDLLHIAKTVEGAGEGLMRIAEAAKQAGLRINPTKTRLVPVRKYKVGKTTEEDIEKLGFPHACPTCGRAFWSQESLNKHIRPKGTKKWCRPGIQGTRNLSIADRIVRQHKTKEMIEKSKHHIAHDGHIIRPVCSEKYLGAIICPSDMYRTERKNRERSARGAQIELSDLLRNNKIPWHIRRRAWQATIGSRLLYGSEAWNPEKLQVRPWLRKWEETAMTFMSRGRAEPGQGPFLELERRYVKQKANWFGHIMRMQEDRTVKQLTRARGQKAFQDSLPPGEAYASIIKKRGKWRKEVEKHILTEFGTPHQGPIKMGKQALRYVKFGFGIYEWKKRKTDENPIKKENTTPNPPATVVSVGERRCSSLENTRPRDAVKPAPRS